MMQKNWYIFYTKPKCEKKVAALLRKRKIENFYPLNCKEISFGRKNKIIYESLFVSYVFVNIAETQIEQMKQIDNIVNLVYWKGRPATITEDEISSIKEFTIDHRDIKLLRSRVVENDMARVVDGPSYSIDGKVLSVKNKTMKVNLPSLGFIMVAEMETESVMGRGISFGNKELSLQ